MSGLSNTSIRLGAFAAVFLVAGLYLVSHPDPARPNLAMIAGFGGLLIAISLMSLVISWNLRVRAGMRPLRSATLSKTAPGQPVASLQVSRPVDTAADFVRKYEIRVDGQLICGLGIGETIEVKLAPGGHTVTAAIGTNLSEPFAVELQEGASRHLMTAATAGPVAYRRANHWLEIQDRNSSGC